MYTKRHFTAEFKAKLVQQMLREEQTINQLAAERLIPFFTDRSIEIL